MNLKSKNNQELIQMALSGDTSDELLKELILRNISIDDYRGSQTEGGLGGNN